MSLRQLLTDGVTSIATDAAELGQGAGFLDAAGLPNPMTLANAKWTGTTFGADTTWDSAKVRLEIDDNNDALAAVRLIRTLPDGFIQALGLQGARQISELSVNPIKMDSRIEAALPLGSATLNVSGRVSDGLLRLELDWKTAPTLADLAHLIGASADGDLSDLPAPLAKAMQVEVSALKLSVDIEDGTLTEAELDLALNADWHILDGLAYPVLEKVTACLVVGYPLSADQRFATVDLSGDIRLTKADGPKIVAGVQWPDWRVSAQMQQGPLPIADLLAGFGVPPVKSAGDITHLSLMARPTGKHKTLLINAEVADLPPIRHDQTDIIRFESVALMLDWSSDGLNAVLGADMVLGKDVELKAQIAVMNGDWQIEASLDASSQTLTLGQAADALTKPLGLSVGLPDALSELALVELSVDADLGGTGLSLTAVAANATGLNIRLALNATRNDAGWALRAEGQLETNGVHFDLSLEDGRLIAILSDDVPPVLSPKDLGDALGLAGLPDAPRVTFNAATAAMSSGQTPARLIGLDLGAGFDFSGLPLVGALLGEASAEMQLLAWTGTPDAAFMGSINSRLPNDVTPFPDADKLGKSPSTRILIKTAGEVHEIDVGVTPKTSGDGVAVDAAPLPNAGSDGMEWKVIDKSMGPLHLRRIGVKFVSPKLTLLLDAEIAMGPVTAHLMGFGADLTLQDDAPYVLAEPRLAGFGLDYKQGDITLSGALIRKGPAHFAGAAELSFPGLGLAAIGDYQEIEGRKSLFVYAVLDRPLGGPAFFFVNGLAAGFGLHRALKMPALDKVADFPLVAAANGRPAADLLDDLDAAVPPQLDTNFGAVGIKFNSFGLIDGFVLVAVQFGKDLEFDVLGLASAVLPPDVKSTPIAKIEIAIQSSYVVSEGVLRVDAALTPASYLFSSKCRLRGGFAFYAWFKDETVKGNRIAAGNFVATLGGYHPDFVVPDGFPDPTRVSITWQVSPTVLIKGDLYCALTNGGIMAGGHISANFHDGAIRAWFEAGLDFLLMWKPFHYDASAYINVGGSYTYHFFGTHTISIDIGATLHVWGPEFAGNAHISLYIVSFDVPLGTGKKPKVSPLTWPEFRTAFLPKEIATLRILKGGAHGSVEPGALCILSDAAVPSSNLVLGTQAPTDGFADLGIPPMNKARGSVNGTHKLRVTMQPINVPLPAGALDDLATDASDQFTLSPRTKALPAGMWGAPGSLTKPTLADASRLPVEGALCGAELTPLPAKPTGISPPAPLKNLLMDVSAQSTVTLGDETATKVGQIDRAAVKAALAAQIPTRDAVAQAFGLTPQGLSALTDYADRLRATPGLRI